VLVPGHADAAHVPVAIAKAQAIVERASLHIVHAGDTLWSIARGAGVRLADLLYWNGLHGDATLHLGQRLRLQAPESTASTAAAGAP
jgi:LysM repeat protein